MSAYNRKASFTLAPAAAVADLKPNSKQKAQLARLVQKSEMFHATAKTLIAKK
jgi:hypothetical protein